MALTRSFITDINRTGTFHRFKSSSSSKEWLRRQGLDPFVKKKAHEHYRSRSAFKLLEVIESFKLLPRKRAISVVDLGAAPGGWSEVMARHTNLIHPREGLKVGSSTSSTILAVDLLPMDPIPGVTILQHDFLAPTAVSLLRNKLITDANPSGLADVILSDMASNSTGNRIRDSEASLIICEAVLQFAMAHLRLVSGVIIMKYFAHPTLEKFREDELEPRFDDVRYFKPGSSRADSAEGYWLCRGWKAQE